MTAIVTNNLRFVKIKSFVNSLISTPLYLGIGKSTPWNDLDEVGATDSAPATPADATSGIDFWDLLSVKRINKENVSFSVPRVNHNSWRTVPVDTLYSYWGEIGATEPNYVLTADYNVYKCITREGSNLSTIAPTGTGTTIFATGDGYEWKYMFSITPQEALNYLSEDWMPVRNVIQQADEAVGSNQWNVMQNTIPGLVTGVNILTGGTGYTSATNVPLIGNGTGGLVNYTAVAGIITSITVVNRGSNYTWARFEPTGGSNFTGEVILSPINGHGSDVVAELDGKYLSINTTLAFDEGSGDFIKANDYRKITLISTPLQFDGNPAILSTYDATSKFVCSSVANILPDDLITSQTGATAQVIEINPLTNTLKVNSLIGSFNVNDTLTFTTNGTNIRNYSLVSITNPELKQNSGIIIYKDYRRYITRDVNQREQLYITLEF